MILFVLLPVASWVILFLIFRQDDDDWRRSLLSASVVWGCILTLITETFSLFSWITFPGLVIAWSISGAILTLLYQKRYSRTDHLRWEERGFLATLWRNFVAIPLFIRFSLVSIALIVLPTALLAIVVPPNEADSMAYHMVRVVNWMQNHNVQPYPTHVTNQLDFPPLSSFICLHLQVLSGGDYLADLVQWFSMVGSVIGVSYIAKQLGSKPVGQTISAVVCATIPLGVLQSSTTQNDYVVTFWFMCFVSNVLRELTQPSTLRTTLEIGGSLGLSILTKPIAYMYGFPFFLLFLGSLVYRRSIKAWVSLAIGILPVLLLNANHWWRNYAVWGHPLGVTGDVARNKLLTLSSFISILSKNIAINIAIPNQTFNDTVLKLLEIIHQAIGLSLSDPRTSMYGQPFNMPSAFPIMLHEAVASNPLHLLLVLISVVLYLSHKPIQSRLLTTYFLALLAGFCLFSFLILWHLSGTRYQLPALTLFSAFVGTVLSAAVTYKILNYLLVVTLCFSAFFPVLFSTVKPVFQNNNFVVTPLDKGSLKTSREIQYFNSFPYHKMLYKAATDIVTSYKCRDIGIYSSLNPKMYPFEYPIWALVKQHETSKYKVNFQSLGVTNSSNQISVDAHPSRSPAPCAVLGLGAVSNPKAQLSFKGIQYQKVPSPRSALVYIDKNQIDVSSNSDLFLSADSTLAFFDEKAKADETHITYPQSILYQQEGWSVPEARGTWTDGSLARLDLPFQSIPPSGFKVLANIQDVFLTERSPQQTVEVRVNGKPITAWTFALGKPLLKNYTFQIPETVARQQTPLSLTFNILDPKSPQELGLSADPRRLGISINRLTFLSQ